MNKRATALALGVSRTVSFSEKPSDRRWMRWRGYVAVQGDGRKRLRRPANNIWQQNCCWEHRGDEIEAFEGASNGRFAVIGWATWRVCLIGHRHFNGLYRNSGSTSCWNHSNRYGDQSDQNCANRKHRRQLSADADDGSTATRLGHTRRNLFVTDVRFGSKADICSANSHVRFTPNSGH